LPFFTTWHFYNKVETIKLQLAQTNNAILLKRLFKLNQA